MKPRAPKHVIAELKEVLRLVDFETTASFGFPTEIATYSSFGEHERVSMSVDALVKERSLHYRTANINPRLKRLLDWSEGR